MPAPQLLRVEGFQTQHLAPSCIYSPDLAGVGTEGANERSGVAIEASRDIHDFGNRNLKWSDVNALYLYI